MRTFSKSLLIASFTLALIWACSDEANQVTNEIALSKSINGIEPTTSSTGSSSQGINPYIITIDGEKVADPSCADVADAFAVDLFEFSSGKLNYDSQTGTFDNDLPEGFTINVTPEQYNGNLGTYVEWSFTPPEGYCNLVNLAVIVQGCLEANVYFYPDGSITTDSGLASQIGGGSVPCLLDNLTFCWNMEPCEEDKCYNCETAFGGDFDPDTKGAWWFAYDVSVGGEQTITAGQHMEVGTVEYVNGEIVINLADGWVLQDTERDDDCVEVLDMDENPMPYDEAVKIQGYNTLPNKRPAAGLFTTYKGMSLNPAVGDGYEYFVIHLDLLQVVECEKE